MEKPLISILMPVYNAANYIEKSIACIQKQTFNNFELIIVNDGSTDDTVELIEKVNDNRIHLINNPHNFINSLNTGIKEAKGKYIARMDVDDYMLPPRLQKQFEFMESNPDVDICGSWVQLFGSKSGLLQTSAFHNNIISYLIFHNTLVHPSIIMKTSLFKKEEEMIREYNHDYPCAEDYHLWTRLALDGYKFANITEPLICYRSSPGQVTSTRFEEMMNSSYKIQKEYIEAIWKNNEELRTRFSEFYESIEDIMDSKEKKDTFHQIYHSLL